MNDENPYAPPRVESVRAPLPDTQGSSDKRHEGVGVLLACTLAGGLLGALLWPVPSRGAPAFIHYLLHGWLGSCMGFTVGIIWAMWQAVARSRQVR
jgi:hypothetical protein